MDYLNALADKFETNAAEGRRQLGMSRDLPPESAGAFFHARLACEYFASAETVGADFKCCGEHELADVRLGLTDSRNRLDACCGAQRDGAVQALERTATALEEPPEVEPENDPWDDPDYIPF